MTGAQGDLAAKLADAVHEAVTREWQAGEMPDLAIRFVTHAGDIPSIAGQHGLRIGVGGDGEVGRTFDVTVNEVGGRSQPYDTDPDDGMPDIGKLVDAMRETIDAADAWTAANAEIIEPVDDPAWDRWSSAFARQRALVAEIDAALASGDRP